MAPIIPTANNNNNINRRDRVFQLTYSTEAKRMKRNIICMFVVEIIFSLCEIYPFLFNASIRFLPINGLAIITNICHLCLLLITNAPRVTLYMLVTVILSAIRCLCYIFFSAFVSYGEYQFIKSDYMTLMLLFLPFCILPIINIILCVYIYLY